MFIRGVPKRFLNIGIPQKINLPDVMSPFLRLCISVIRKARSNRVCISTESSSTFNSSATFVARLYSKNSTISRPMNVRRKKKKLKKICKNPHFLKLKKIVSLNIYTHTSVTVVYPYITQIRIITSP